MFASQEPVLIVGAGPSGLLLGVMLARASIPTLVLEASHQLDQQPRAAHYMPVAVPVLQRAGILDLIMQRGGIRLEKTTWRLPDSFERLTGLDGGVMKDIDGVDMRPVCFALQDLLKLMLEVYLGLGGQVSWEHKVVDIGQEEGGNEAWCEVETKEGRKKITGSYVAGCDGATSRVRRSLFGDEFPGFTWDAQIIATNTIYNVQEKFGWDDATLVIHPEHFFLAGKLNNEGLWRITYGDKPGLTREEYKSRQQEIFEKMLPGHPKPGEYEVLNWSPYKMHQRCAPSFRVGRVLLCADAAHVCNPWGGLGITGGFVDVGGLADCLVGIWEGRADDLILDLYSEKRIEKWKTIVDPITTDNFKRVSDKDPATLMERDGFLQMLKGLEHDEVQVRNFMMAGLELSYDFTQHYHTK